RHTRFSRDWSSDVCSSDLKLTETNFGRDHHPRCFTLWMAGGGVKAGHIHGETCEFGYNIIKDPVHVHDFHATLLHLLGMNHERQIGRASCRERVTSVVRSG